MEEIEVGEYIRTPYHSIEKIKRISKENGWTCITTDRDAYELKWLKNNKVKHSKNIIDLIEVGDYVNGHRVTESKYKQYDKYYFIDIDCNDISFGWGIGVIPVDEIKSIVTHEKFASIEYKVEE